MAGFCTKCGRPLPENGICPCTMQQPNQPPQGYAAPVYSAPANKAAMMLGSAFKNLPKLFLGYFRDPAGTARLASEKQDFVSGLILMAFSLILTLLGTLFFVLIHVQRRFLSVLVPWFLTGLIAPVFAYGITIGLTCALLAIAKRRVDIRGVVAAVGVSSVIPVTLLAVTMLLGMAAPFLFEFFAVLIFAAWVVGLFNIVVQVYGIKMNIFSTILLILGLAAAFYVIVLLLNWLVYGSFQTLLLPFNGGWSFSSFYDYYIPW